MGSRLDTLIAALREAVRGNDPVRAVTARLEEAIRAPDALRAALPALGDGDETLLFEEEAVSIWHCCFHPHREVPPHEHRMPAIIGVFAGVEINTFYRCDGAGLERVSTRPVYAGETLAIGEAGVHSVRAGGTAASHAIHVYLGPLTAVERFLFDWESGAAQPFNEASFAALSRHVPVSGGA